MFSPEPARGAAAGGSQHGKSAIPCRAHPRGCSLCGCGAAGQGDRRATLSGDLRAGEVDTGRHDRLLTRLSRSAAAFVFTKYPSSLAPIIPPAGILPSGARRDDGAHRPQGAARVVGAGFDGHSTSSGFDVLEDLSEECPHDSGDDECYKTVEGGTPIGFTPIIPPAASEPGSDVGPAGAC